MPIEAADDPLDVLFTPAGVAQSGLPKYVHRLTGLTFVKVPAGNLLLSSDGHLTAPDSSRDSRELAAEIALSSFLIAEKQVGIDEWADFFETGWGPWSGSQPFGAAMAEETGGGSVSVTWYGAYEACRILGLSLPTEAEWVLARSCGAFVASAAKDAQDRRLRQGAAAPTPITKVAGEWCLDDALSDLSLAFRGVHSPVANPVCEGPNSHPSFGGMVCRKMVRNVTLPEVRIQVEAKINSPTFRPVYRSATLSRIRSGLPRLLSAPPTVDEFLGDPGAYGFEHLGDYVADGIPVYIHQNTEIRMCLLRGSADDGSGSGESVRAGSGLNRSLAPRPAENVSAHETKCSPFLIAEAEISLQTWGNVMGIYSPLGGIDTDAMTMVSFRGCELFCEKTGLFIPSESQWVFACFGRDRRQDPTEPTGARPVITSGSAYRLLLPGNRYEGAPNGHKLYYMQSDAVGEWCKPDDAGAKDHAKWAGRRARLSQDGRDEAVILGLWRSEDADNLQGLTALISGRDVSYPSVGFRPCYPLR
jgi:formylglycine-generating enzyme required for sulfatase activity